MPFDSGRVSFCRLLASGTAPRTVNEEVLETLTEHGFVEGEFLGGRPDQVEGGWLAGDHLFDTRFEYEKNGFGHILLCAVRIDTNRVPADVRRAYRLMHERAAAAGNPSGFASKAQKAEARDAVDRQIHDELASGKHRKSKLVPIMWDLKREHVYCGATSNAILEELARLMRETFGVTITHLSAGSLASDWARQAGLSRELEDVRPTPFTKPPRVAGSQQRRDDDDQDAAEGAAIDPSIPSPPWAASFEIKDYLGNEMLLWLWHRTETAEGLVNIKLRERDTEIALVIDRSLDMDCAWGVSGKQTLRGEAPTQLAEAAEALLGGKWPRKAGLMLSDGEHQWELTLQADQFSVNSAALPPLEDVDSPRQLIESRLELTTLLAEVIDGLFAAFLAERLSNAWPAQRDAMRDWIVKRRRRRA